MSGGTPPRVLLDANILVAAFFRGPEYAPLRLAREGRLRPVLCDYALAEAGHMLRGAFPARAGALDALLELPGAQLVGSPTPEELSGFGRMVGDAADDPLLAAALLAGADYLVTSDRAFRADGNAWLAARGESLRLLSVPELLRELAPDAPHGS